MRLRSLVVALAIAGSFDLIVACGSRTGVGLFEDLGGDGSGQDASNRVDATLGDVMVAEVVADAPSDFRARDAGKTDAAVESANDADDADVAPYCTEAGDSGALIQSCQPGGPGLTNCGACSESCCASLEVTRGTYYRAYDVGAGGVVNLAPDGGPTNEANPATVSGFRLDKYLVTVGRFRQFVAAVMPTDAGPSGYTPPAASGKHTHLNNGLGLENSGESGDYETGWLTTDDDNIAPTNGNLACGSLYDTWTNAATGGHENLPINCMNWYEAYAFCIWDGGFLPSDAEYEYAAAAGGGANGQRQYPWGSTAPGAANQYAIYGCHYPSGSGSCASVANIAPVGTALLGAGYWGQLDLAGDVWEWNLDWFATYVDPCTDCAYLSPSPPGVPDAERVIRGSFFYTPSVLISAGRFPSVPTDRTEGIGFRCARSP